MSGDIRSRLERLRRSGELQSAGTLEGKTGDRPPFFLFPGEERETETDAGRCYYRELCFPLAGKHGNAYLNGLINCRGADLALPGKNPALVEFSPGRSLFLDIETTGLSGGTGTWAFLIGMGWVENDIFRLRQYFLRHPREEKAMLLHFTRRAAQFSDLVTFNGRAFDLPLIVTRQVLAGLPHTSPRLHLDLLPCSRRLWKERLSSCSLRSLEEALLGLHRHGDIPGEEIPYVYFSYLRRGETALLRDVFQHNVLDILSMATLLTRVARAAAGEDLEHPADYYSLGKLCAEAGEMDKAVRCLQKTACNGDERLTHLALLQLSMILKKQKQWDEAAKLWRELVGCLPYDLTPYIELAKYYEHQAGEYEAALSLTRQAVERTRRRFSAPATGELSLPALQHRLARLRRKLGENI
ncbi:MAG: ribonuclease H-like domain-containing protein [Bacillota bacterium]